MCAAGKAFDLILVRIGFDDLYVRVYSDKDTNSLLGGVGEGDSACTVGLLS